MRGVPVFCFLSALVCDRVTRILIGELVGGWLISELTDRLGLGSVCWVGVEDQMMVDPVEVVDDASGGVEDVSCEVAGFRAGISSESIALEVAEFAASAAKGELESVSGIILERSGRPDMWWVGAWMDVASERADFGSSERWLEVDDEVTSAKDLTRTVLALFLFFGLLGHWPYECSRV